MLPVSNRCVRFVFPTLFVVGTALLVGSTGAQASPVVNFQMHVLGGASGDPNAVFNQAGVFVSPNLGYNYQQNGPGVPLPYNTNGIHDVAAQWDITSWNFNADGDPTGPGGAKIATAFVVSNTMAEVGGQPLLNHLFFSIMITMGVNPSAGPTTFYGNGGMTLTVTPGQLGSVNTQGGPMINYMINGADVASLFSAPYSLNSPSPITTSDSGNLSAAQVASLANTHPNSMGIRLDFDLSPGETVSFNGAFGFVPTPGGLALLGLAGIVGRRRRRA